MRQRIIKKRGFSGIRNPEISERELKNRAVARKAAAEGMVLLKNEKGILPLAPGSRVALYGIGASRTIKGGTGSGDVNERERVSIYQGMKHAGFVITNEDWILDYDRRYEEARTAWRDGILEKTAGAAQTSGAFFQIYTQTPFVMPEGKAAETIFVTGNTAIDALKTTVKEDYTHPELDWAKGSRLIMITAHRRENLGEPMKHMFRAIRRVCDEHPDIKAVYPIHMNPAVRETADEILGGDERIRIIEPLDVLDFHNFLARSYLILTDSGGIQEEAPSLGKPVLVMRDTTERPEGIRAGTLKLVGTEEEVIYENFKLLLENRAEYEKMSMASNPYGDGLASKRIADILEGKL